MNLPEQKTFNWPIWHNSENMILSKDDIVGTMAMWAVKQSPYICPDDLKKAVIDLQEYISLNLKFSNMGFTYISIENLRRFLCNAFEKINIIEKWNKPKKGYHDFVFLSCYNEVYPDYDFIDLHALARNIAHTCGMEYFYWK